MTRDQIRAAVKVAKRAVIGMPEPEPEKTTPDQSDQSDDKAPEPEPEPELSPVEKQLQELTALVDPHHLNWRHEARFADARVSRLCGAVKTYNRTIQGDDRAILIQGVTDIRDQLQDLLEFLV